MSRAILPDDIYRVLNGYEDTMRRLSQAVYQPHTAPIEFAAPGASADTNLYRLQQDTLATDDDLWIGGATLRFTLAGARLTFMGGGTVNRYNIDNLNGNFRIYREAADGSGGAVRLSITDAGAVNIPGNLTVGGTFTPTGALTLSGRLSITTPSVGIRIGEGYAKASQQEFLQTWNATDSQDWSLYRPGGTRDFVFYSSAFGNVLTLQQSGSLVFAGPDFIHSGTGLTYIAGAGLRTNNSLGNLHLDPIKPDGSKGSIYLNWYGGTSNGSLIYANGNAAPRFTVNTGGAGEFYGSVRAYQGSGGIVGMVAGGPNNAGYLEWHTPNGTRQAYMGNNTNNTGVTLQMEQGSFAVAGAMSVSGQISANSTAGIRGPTGEMISGYDSWLRLNNASSFSSGLYIPGRGVDITGSLRIGTGGSIQIGGAGLGSDGTVVIDGNQGHYATHYRTRLVTSHDFYAIYKVSETGDIGGGVGYNQKLYIRNHHGIKYDAYSGGGGHRFYCGYNADGNVAGLLFSIGEGDSVVRSYAHTRVTAGGRTVDVLDGSGNSSFVARIRDMPVSTPWHGPDGESTPTTGLVEILRSDGGTVRPTITPSEDLYWEVSASFIVRCHDASWNRADAWIDLIGVGSGNRTIIVLHSALVWQTIHVKTIFALNKGTTYTARALFQPSTGTWSYYHGVTYSAITGKVVAFR